MMAIVAVISFLILVLGMVLYWLREDGEHAPEWLLDKHPHDKYDEMN